MCRFCLHKYDAKRCEQTTTTTAIAVATKRNEFINYYMANGKGERRREWAWADQRQQRRRPAGRTGQKMRAKINNKTLNLNFLFDDFVLFQVYV